MKRKLFKFLKRFIIITLAIAALLAITTFFYMRQAKFGKAPSGERLALMKKSPNFKNGQFENLTFTPQFAEGHTMLGVMYDFIFKKVPGRKPVDNIPSVKVDLLNLSIDSNILVWFGHSSYFMQIDGKRILVDPVFSGNASPIPGTNKSFKGTDIYSVADIPAIDYLFITHDHYDHVDHQTLTALKNKTRKIICGLGVGSHLEYWGYKADQVVEKDWNEQIDLDSGFIAYTAPARHFSGRGFSKNNTLWLSYILQTPTMKIYIGGDSGYDTHFADIGEKYGPIDLAILENGQYDVAWQYIHLLPDEVLKAAHDLKAKRLFPVHSSKFAMAMHPWDEPLIKVTELNNGSSNPIPLVTPILGEVVFLKDDTQQFKQWWKGVK